MGKCGRCHRRFSRKELETVSIINKQEYYNFLTLKEEEEIRQSWTDYYCEACITRFNKLMKLFLSNEEI